MSYFIEARHAGHATEAGSGILDVNLARNMGRCTTLRPGIRACAADLHSGVASAACQRASVWCKDGRNAVASVAPTHSSHKATMCRAPPKLVTVKHAVDGPYAAALSSDAYRLSCGTFAVFTVLSLVYRRDEMSTEALIMRALARCSPTRRTWATSICWGEDTTTGPIRVGALGVVVGDEALRRAAGLPAERGVFRVVLWVGLVSQPQM